MAGVSDPSVSGYFAPLTSAVESWCPVTRGAGSWSRQTAPAVDGTTFIELGTAQNTGRFDYSPVGRSMLLIEPTRVAMLPESNFVDAGANNIPDGWALLGGTAGVDWACIAGGPHGGLKFRFLATAPAGDNGVYDTGSLTTGGVTYVASVWARRDTAGAAQLYGWDRGGANAMISIGAVACDWTRFSAAEAAIAARTTMFPLAAAADLPGIVDVACPDVEAGDVATSHIPCAGGVKTRAAELCTVDASIVGRTSGHVSFLWRPDYANDAALSVSPVLFAWAPNWELYYDPADDKLKVLADGAAGAESAALTFSRQALFRVSVRYGAAGTELIVDQAGVGAGRTTDPSAWGTPALACYLGSRAASVNCRPAAFGDLLISA